MALCMEPRKVKRGELVVVGNEGVLEERENLSSWEK